MSGLYADIHMASVYTNTEPEKSFYIRRLYELLAERKPHENISHRKLPSLEDHTKFVESKPYKEWYLVQNNKYDVVGSVYLTDKNEIGVFIFDKHKGNQYGSAAIRGILDNHPGKTFYANINPMNEQSIHTFKKFGFTLVQCTYARQVT